MRSIVLMLALMATLVGRAQKIETAPDSLGLPTAGKSAEQHLKAARTWNTVGYVLSGVAVVSLVGLVAERSKPYNPNPNAFVNIDLRGLGWSAALGLSGTAAVVAFIMGGQQKKKATRLQGGVSVVPLPEGMHTTAGLQLRLGR